MTRMSNNSGFRMIFVFNQMQSYSEKAKKLQIALVVVTWISLFLLFAGLAMILPTYFIYRYDWYYILRIGGYCLMGLSCVGFIFNSLVIRRWLISELIENDSRNTRTNQVANQQVCPAFSSDQQYYSNTQYGHPPTNPAYPPLTDPAYPPPMGLTQPVQPPSYSSVALQNNKPDQPPPAYPGTVQQ